MEDIAESVEDILGLLGNVRVMVNITCRVVHYPRDSETEEFIGWINREECLLALNELYSDIKNGFACMALINRPFENADIKP